MSPVQMMEPPLKPVPNTPVEPHSSSLSFWSQVLELCFWPEELGFLPIPAVASLWALGDSFRE